MSALQVIDLTQQLERRDARIIELEKVINLSLKVYEELEDDGQNLLGLTLWDDFGHALQSIVSDLEKTS